MTYPSYAFDLGGTDTNVGGTLRWIDRHILEDSGSGRERCASTTRRSALATLFGLPFRYTHPTRGTWELSTSITLESGSYDASIGGGASEPHYTYASSASDGQTSPYVFDSSWSGEWTPPPGWVGATLIPNIYGWTWSPSVGDWPAGDWIEVVYLRTSPDPGGTLPGTMLVRFLVTGDADLSDPSDICCDLPNWWPTLFGEDPAAASAMYLAMVHFWQDLNSADPTAAWLEDRLSLPSGWPRITLEMPYSRPGGVGHLLLQLPQVTDPSERAHLMLAAPEASYPCLQECAPGFADLVVQVERIADSLVSGEHTVSSLLSDLKRTVAAAATSETSLKTAADGLVISTSTGVAGGGS